MTVDGQNRLIGEGYNDDVIKAMRLLYDQYKDTAIDLLPDLKNSSLDIDGKCQSIFAYMVDNVRYQLDPGVTQMIRTPYRLLQEGAGDCKSFTMFICCCLHGLGISHKMRFVSFDNSKIYTHVYAVALDEKGEEIIMDACETDRFGRSIYDYARNYTHKKDIIYYE